jgi:hypothetical protein
VVCCAEVCGYLCAVTPSDKGAVTCESSNIKPYLMEASLVEPAELIMGLVTLKGELNKLTRFS